MNGQPGRLWQLDFATNMTKRSATKIKTPTRLPRFDVGTLREVAGDKVFVRGAEYHQGKQVDIVSIEKTRVLAKVVGSEIYRTELNGAGSKFSGHCSCPAFSDWGFCKHLVATALAANDIEPGALEHAANRLPRIRDHLRSKSVGKLVDIIMELVEREPALLKDLELAATTDVGDDKALFTLFKKAITEATRTHGFVEYREARGWTQGIERVLDRIEGLIEQGRAELVLQLLDHFFVRMDDALLNMDDSDGHGGGVYARACEVHRAACGKAKPDPVRLARELFAREVDSDWDFFHAASAIYGEVLGEAGLTEYRRLAAEAWKQIKPLRADARRADDDQSSLRHRLQAILEQFAENDDDLDGRIAIRAKDLSSAFKYLGIAQLCLERGRDVEALKWTEEGLWQFEDAPDQRLVVFAADLYARAGRREDASKLLWQTFERVPSIELYRRLKAAAVGDRAVTEARDRALALLRAQIGSSDRPAAARWSSPVELLLTLMMTEGLLAKAWDIVRKHGCSDGLLKSLAEASERSHPFESLQAHAHRVDHLVRMGGNGNYEDACRIIERMRQIRERLDKKSDHAAYLGDLKSRHKAKRNFMKLLQARR